jgi:predicted amidohydrolase
VAQLSPESGSIRHNIERHLMWIDHAIAYNSDLIIFPELSITGYEPALAKDLAIEANDKRLHIFQSISNTTGIVIGLGVPFKIGSGITISLLLFQPQKQIAVYTKKYLHPDEDYYFISAEGVQVLTIKKVKIGFSICYELSIPEHAEQVYQQGASIYIASVAKSVGGVEKAADRLSQIAKEYSMTVLMSNFIGHCDNFDCGGKSSVWNEDGNLLAQLDAQIEGILIFDTITNTVVNKID